MPKAPNRNASAALALSATTSSLDALPVQRSGVGRLVAQQLPCISPGAVAFIYRGALGGRPTMLCIMRGLPTAAGAGPVDRTR